MRQFNIRPFVDDTMARRIVTEWGTPVFVYDERLLREAAGKALGAADRGLTVRYAMKANPAAAILRLFDSLGLHIDASSCFEARRAMAAGVDLKKILLTAQDLNGGFKRLIAAGIAFNACSLHQLAAFGGLFPGHSLGLRINPGFGGGHSGKTTVGGPYAAFGIWHEDLDEAREIAMSHDLSIERVHIHVGSGIDAETARRAARSGTEMLARFPDATALNLGGGFPVARMGDEQAPDISSIARQYAAVVAEFCRRSGRDVRLEIEPGTFLAANAGALLTAVCDVKKVGRRRFIVIDAGMSEIIRPSLYGSRHPIWSYPAVSSGGASERYAVVGHCCESGDLITVGEDSLPAERELPMTSVGDLLLIGGVGAYCAAMSAKNYNSFPEAAEVMIGADGEPRLIRRRQTLEQMVQNEM